MEIAQDEVDVCVSGIVDKGLLAELDGLFHVPFFDIERSEFLHDVGGKGVMPEGGFQLLDGVIQPAIQSGKNAQNVVISGSG